MKNKIKNGDLPAFSKAAFYHPDGGSDSPNDGVTKREYFAAMAMQGLIDTFNGEDSNELATRSIQAADELLKQLDNEKDQPSINTQTYHAFKGELIQDEIGNLKPKKNEQ